MSAYMRPTIAPLVFHDAEGHIIDYGNRWPGSPPEDSYSVDHDTERFAPLHAVAETLIEHLAATYDVAIVDDPTTVADLTRQPPAEMTVVRSVRVSPSDPRCAALTFVLTDYPSVWVQTGLLHTAVHPFCGCDACDSTWEVEADELERTVLAVATGGFREAIVTDQPTPRSMAPYGTAWIESTFAFADGGGRSGRSLADDVPHGVLAPAAKTLDTVPDGWRVWPLRAAAD